MTPDYATANLAIVSAAQNQAITQINQLIQ